MEVEQLRPGLWRWTAPHPEWSPSDAGPEGWEQEVGSACYEAPEATVLVDPQLPPEDERPGFWDVLDAIVRRRDLPVVVVLTASWHRRSTDELRERYRAGVWQSDSEAEPPAGVEAIRGLEGVGDEVLLWLPEHRALVAGDSLLGDARGLRRCPAGWIDGDEESFRASLRRAAELPIELVLTAHGPPVRSGGQAAVRTAIERERKV